MAKSKNKNGFFCKECGYESIKWLGQCPSCNAWNSFEENKFETSIEGLDFINLSKWQIEKPKTLNEISDSEIEKIKTGDAEFDNLLGGGIVKGSITLIGGAPGIGKSTLILQIVKGLSDNNKRILYVTGEESLSQIKLRANRIGHFNDNVLFLSEINITKILSTAIEMKPDVLIIDSIQTMSINNEALSVGSQQDIRNITSYIFRIAKEYEISTFIIGHITKDGQVAGPKMLEHMVDTVLYFEDDTSKNLRLLRTKKNRFGSNNELCIYEMKNDGLKSIKNPSEIFLDGGLVDASGNIVTCIIDSNRPIFIEIQALVTKSSFGLARRNINGSDSNRLNLLIAILEKRMNIPLYQYDIYVNITGGLKIKDPSIDLAIIMAILSSYKEKPLGKNVIYVGEVGLSGEVRGVSQINLRLKEAIKLGYKLIFIPFANMKDVDKKILENNQITIKPIKDVIN